MYAIIKTGGKQYRVAQDDVIEIEKLKEKNASDEVIFDEVLAVGEGSDLKIGTPVVEGASVKAEILESGKSPKVIVYKYKSKKDYRRKQGHRQPFMKVKITSIEALFKHASAAFNLNRPYAVIGFVNVSSETSPFMVPYSA